MTHQPTILLVDDDPQDRMLIEDAFKESSFEGMLCSVADADQMYDYLVKEATEAPSPSLILLDLNLPRKDGRQVLRELKNHSKFRTIPVVILTTSRAAEDVEFSYHNGANTFMQKPESFAGLIDLVKNLRSYWFKSAILPMGV